jgi:hypothetical protein
MWYDYPASDHCNTKLEQKHKTQIFHYVQYSLHVIFSYKTKIQRHQLCTNLIPLMDISYISQDAKSFTPPELDTPNQTTYLYIFNLIY